MKVTVEGVGLPGHFIVRHAPAGAEPVWIDVFDGGKRLDRAGVAKLYREMRGAELTDDLLAPEMTLRAGDLHVPAGPGIGFTVDEAKLARYALRQWSWR